MKDEADSLKLAELTTGAFLPIAEAMPAMLWIGDEDGRCVYLNKALREFWGVSPTDIPRFTWSSTLLEEDAPALFATFAEAMEARRPFTVSARYRRADGAIRRLLTKAEPRFAPNGQFLGMVGVNIDATEDPVLQRALGGAVGAHVRVLEWVRWDADRQERLVGKTNQLSRGAKNNAGMWLPGAH